MTEADHETYIRLDEAAALLGLSPRQTRRYAEGEAPRLRTRKIKHRTLFHRGDVAALARDFAAVQAPPPPRAPATPPVEPVADQEQLDPLTVGELITLKEAAEYSGLSVKSLHDYVRRERLRARKLGSQWVTTQAAIDQYLVSRDPRHIPRTRRTSV